MQKKQRNEEKITRDWRIVLLVSSIVILLVVGFFIIQSIFGNPLKGEWMCEERGYYLEVDDAKELTVQVIVKGEPIEVELYYTMDKEAKVITVKPNLDSYAEAAEDAEGRVSASEIDEHLIEFLASYQYSLEKDTLTLTNREYGEQFIFTKVK